MDKKTYEEKALHHEEAEIARIKAISDAALRRTELNRTTNPDSQYHSFEISFGTERLKEINDFLFSLDKSEFNGYPNLKDPLLKICQKFLDWKVEVGNDRLSHEMFIRHDRSENSQNNQGSLYVIGRAWEQVKAELNIIEPARQKYKSELNKMQEENPTIATTDPARWCALCDEFNEFEALQEFGYPLPFDTIFGAYTPKPFYYGKPQDNI